MTEFAIKDSGTRQEFAGGMVRDTTEGKANFLSVRFGPMLRRWAAHLTAGREKYPDPQPGVPNWTLATGVAEYLRAKESASRHFEQWLDGERDEDHASAVFFNMNLAEYVLENDPSIDPALGVSPLPDAPAPPPISDVPASKPWRIIEDPSVPPGVIVGFTGGGQISGGPRDPLAFNVGDLVKIDVPPNVHGNGRTGVIQKILTDIRVEFPFEVLVEGRGLWTPYRENELVLIEPACNGHCLGCDAEVCGDWTS